MGLDMYLYAERRLSEDDANTIVGLFTDEIKQKEAAAKTADAVRELGYLKSRFEGITDDDDEGMYVGGWSHGTGKEQEIYRRILDLAGASDVTTDGSPHLLLKQSSEGELQVRVCVAYWRKANQVHGWFVEKVQDGVDECQLSPVTREQLLELDAACAKAIKKRTKTAAMATIPPTEGFFFGSSDVDSYYWQDLAETRQQIARALTLPETWSFAYRSSW